ncbi:cytochrome P450 [Saccharothrix obliqua]|uniref:cytochrome P450 n=1 Tax=Saccharothrix obliqua TaxID=2861747 RepID=UPI001C5D9D7B|nr:cytochrome P450 [Saccharothrix obliqua]MBW4717831.1 cytochrome P450 [Saccharothrix obliqua]
MTTTAEPMLPLRRGRTCPFSPAEEFARLRAEEPVFRTTLPTGDEAWVVTRHADILRVLGDPAGFSNAVAGAGPIPPPRDAEGRVPAAQPGFFVAYDPPDHGRYRRAIARELGVRRVNRLADRVERICAEHLDAFAARGPGADFMASVAHPVTSSVICELLGVPRGGRPAFRRRAERLFDLTTTPEQQAANFTEMGQYMAELVRGHRNAPGPGLVGRLVRDHGEDFTDAELAGTANLLLLAGHETTANMLGLGLLLLLRHPEQAALVRARPALARRAVEELLRYLTVVHYGVVLSAVVDTEVAGVPIRAGEWLMCAFPSGNRDPDYLADADRFDVTREPTAHLAFGHGIHYCAGAALARLQLRTVLGQVLRRFPELRLGVPFEEVRFQSLSATYGLAALPLQW